MRDGSTFARGFSVTVKQLHSHIPFSVVTHKSIRKTVQRSGHRSCHKRIMLFESRHEKTGDSQTARPGGTLARGLAMKTPST